jgi:hypothetical protein
MIVAQKNVMPTQISRIAVRLNTLGMGWFTQLMERFNLGNAKLTSSGGNSAEHLK